MAFRVDSAHMLVLQVPVVSVLVHTQQPAAVPRVRVGEITWLFHVLLLQVPVPSVLRS
jgi:hypothetical protein